MKLCSYGDDGRWTVGIVIDGVAVEAGDALRAAGLDGSADRVDVRSVLALGDDERGRAQRAAGELRDAGMGHDLAELRLGPPVPDPEKIVCLGLNYRDHAQEAGLPIPEVPILFAKFRNSLIGHGAEIVPPAHERRVDYEGELAVVIGRAARRVSAADALEHVAGFMPFNDVSARDLQMQTGQWMAGKAIDTFAPCGPVLVTSDEVADVQDLRLQTRVNGQTMQDGSTADMIFSVAEALAFISSLMTLVPGDIIATGTPAGVGFAREPAVLLTAGDEVEVEIESLGTLRNAVGVAQ